MTAAAERVIVLDVVGLQPPHITGDEAPAIAEHLAPDTVATLDAPFPAVTIPVQTTLATGQSPATHGDVANGEYDRATDTVAFWERDRADRDRLWETVTERTDLTTGALFMQHLIGSSADVAITPSPIEDEDNNMLEMDCWTRPDGLYDDLYDDYGHFPLHNYWGPMAGAASSEWILDAAREAIDRADPDLLWVYVPHLDYTGLRDGPESEAHGEALATVDDLVGDFLDWLADRPRWDETALTVLGEYGFNSVSRPVFPNRALREAGLLTVADDGDVDLAASDAFAMVDHQVAHVYCEDSVAIARDALTDCAGIERVVTDPAAVGLDHPHTGDIVLVAAQDAWFQYYWWPDGGGTPPYAMEMDIHAKPGFDPCELVHGDDGLVSLDAAAIGGSHGRTDDGALGVCAFGGPAAPDSLAVPDRVDATAVAPTVADLLGVHDAVGDAFEGSSLLADARDSRT
jgi:predicted AlkP superfamily pyrophosphatase or phosphodiesterase